MNINRKKNFYLKKFYLNKIIKIFSGLQKNKFKFLILSTMESPLQKKIKNKLMKN